MPNRFPPGGGKPAEEALDRFKLLLVHPEYLLGQKSEQVMVRVGLHLRRFELLILVPLGIALIEIF